jgi:DNA polymerase III subunit beta
MHVQLDQSDLLEMIQAVIDVIPAKATLPMLSNVLMTANEGMCTLSGTDLEISVTISRSIEAIEEGRATLPARKFHDIVRELPAGAVDITERDGRITLQSSTGGEYSMLSMAPDDYPAIPNSLEDGFSLVMDGDLLSRMISKVTFAAPSDETRPALSGVCWRVSSQQTSMLATDGYRLARIAETVDVEPGEPIEAIVPPRVLNQAVRLVRPGNELQGIEIGARQIQFRYAEADLFARLIEGSYIDVDAVIPQDNDYHLIASREALIPAVRRVIILSSQQNHQVKISLRRDMFELSTVDRETGSEAQEEIGAEYSSEDLALGYNAEYLQEILNKTDSPQVRFKFREPAAAAIIEPAAQTEGENYFFLLMPLRLIDG